MNSHRSGWLLILSMFILFFLQGAIKSEPFFGIHATVKRLGPQVYCVYTDRNHSQTGVVQAIQTIKPNTTYSFTIKMKGKGNVYFKVEEFSGNGKYIKDHISKPKKLNHEYSSFYYTLTTTKKTKQMDLFILTKDKGNSFTIQSPQIVEGEK